MFFIFNFIISGYKIFYLVTDSPQKMDKKPEEELEVVPATFTSHSLVFLDKYTEYRIQILAFNPAGDGPRSHPITVNNNNITHLIFFSRLLYDLADLSARFYCLLNNFPIIFQYIYFLLSNNTISFFCLNF